MAKNRENILREPARAKKRKLVGHAVAKPSRVTASEWASWHRQRAAMVMEDSRRDHHPVVVAGLIDLAMWHAARAVDWEQGRGGDVHDSFGGIASDHD